MSSPLVWQFLSAHSLTWLSCLVGAGGAVRCRQSVARHQSAGTDVSLVFIITHTTGRETRAGSMLMVRLVWHCDTVTTSCEAHVLRLHATGGGMFQDGLLDHHKVLSCQDYSVGQTGAHTGGSGNRTTFLATELQIYYILLYRSLAHIYLSCGKISPALYQCPIHCTFIRVICKQLTGMFF